MNILAILVQLRDDLKSWVSLNFEALNKKIDKKSRARFSRDYYDLHNAPQITEDDKKALSIADEQGNVIFKLDKDGAHTTNLTLNGEEAASQKYVQEAIEDIDFPVTDLTGYATEDFVEKAIENIDFPETDLTDYATKKNVEEAIDAIEFPETDLTGYATEQYVDKKVADLVDSAPEALNTLGELAEAMGEHEDAYDALLETVGQKATRKEVKDLEKALSNGVESDAEEYCIADKDGNMIFKADKDGVETTAVKTKALTVDGEDLATHIQNAIEDIEFPETDLSNYPTKGEVEQAIADIEFPVTDLTGYATEEYVKNKIVEAKLEGEDIDLSGYATKSDLNGFIKEIPVEYVNELELGEVIEQTKRELGESTSSDAEEFQIADEEGNVIVRINKDGVHTTNLTFGGGVAATQEFVNEAIENIQFPETDLSNYPTKEEVQQAIADINFPETDLTDYATKKFVGEEIAKIEFPETDLAGYATEKFVTDEIGKIEFPETDLTGYATEDYVDKAIEAINFPETDLSDYATKQNVEDAVLAHKQNTDIHITKEEREGWFDGKYSSLEGAPSIDEADDTTYSIADPEGNVIFKVDENGTHTTNLTVNGEVATTKQYVDGAIKQAVGNINIPEVDLSNHATKQYVDEAIDNIEFPVTDLTDYATETYVEEAIKNIDFPETDLTDYATK